MMFQPIHCSISDYSVKYNHTKEADGSLVYHFSLTIPIETYLENEGRVSFKGLFGVELDGFPPYFDLANCKLFNSY